jgi:hypothetical protein
MGRPLRFIPEDGSGLVEITCRTIHGMFLFSPSPRFNEILIGVLARAHRLHPVGISAVVCLSNHSTCCSKFRTRSVLPTFMQYVNCNLAREVGRLSRAIR